MTDSGFQWTIEADPEVKARTEAAYAMPGETVVRKTTGYNHALRNLSTGTMTVEATYVRRGPQPDIGAVTYVFKGIMGEYDAGFFQDSRGPKHKLGIVINRMDRLWFVPCDPRSRVSTPIGNALPLERAMGRLARYQIAPSDQDMERFFDTQEGEPSIGEFTLVPTNGDMWMIHGCTWNAPTSAAEVEAVEQIVRVAGLAERMAGVLDRVTDYVTPGTVDPLARSLREPDVVFLPVPGKSDHLSAIGRLITALLDVQRLKPLPLELGFDAEETGSIDALLKAVVAKQAFLRTNVVSFDDVRNALSGSFGDRDITQMVREAEHALSEAETPAQETSPPSP